MKKENQKYIIGIDGGGTETTAALANLKGKILKISKAGSTNSNKIGFKKALSNLKILILELLDGISQKKVILAFLGLAGGLERDKEKRLKIKKVLEKDFSFPIIVEGDQRIAFQTGSNKKNGLIIIAGTGSIAMGWKDNKEAIAGGWDWMLGDQGSAFWTGKKALEKTIKIFDKRVKKNSILLDIILEEWQIQEEKDFYQKFYDSNFVEKVSSVSKLVNEAAKQGDKLAREILKEAGKELALMAKAVIKKLGLKQKFSIVLIGGMFKSEIVLENTKKEIKKFHPKAYFIKPKEKPVKGAIKLAIEELKKLC